MNNTPASLLKKITLKRDSLAEAKAAHAEAVRTASASARSLGYSDPVDNAIDKARADADSRAVYDAYRLVKRRAYALAGLEDALDRAHFMAAAAHRAADAALHDADLDATAEDRAAYARTRDALEEAAEAVAAARSDAAARWRVKDTETIAQIISTAKARHAAEAAEAEVSKRGSLDEQRAAAAVRGSAERAYDAARYAALSARCSAGSLADLQAAAASAQDAMTGSGSAAQDAANRAWNKAAAQDAAALRPTADGEAVDAVASLATLPASLVEAARAYLAAVAADCGVSHAARHFGAEKAAVGFENTGNAAAEARALISAADYNRACAEIDARRAAAPVAPIAEAPAEAAHRLAGTGSAAPAAAFLAAFNAAQDAANRAWNAAAAEARAVISAAAAEAVEATRKRMKRADAAYHRANAARMEADAAAADRFADHEDQTAYAAAVAAHEAAAEKRNEAERAHFAARAAYEAARNA